MSKLSEKVAGLLLNLARKVDDKTVESKCTYPAAQLHFLDQQPIIMYDKYHVEKIHAQHMLSRDTLMFSKNFDMERYVTDSLARCIADELLKLYGDNIKQEENYDGRIYSLDIYVCKPQKKESQE